MICANCVKTKIDGLKMLKLQLNLLSPNEVTSLRLAHVLAMVLGVLDRCDQNRELKPEYYAIIDAVYAKALSFLTDAIISVEIWQHKEDVRDSN